MTYACFINLTWNTRDINVSLTSGCVIRPCKWQKIISEPGGLVSKAIPAHSQTFWGYLHLCVSIIVAKTTSGFNSDCTIRQYAHGLLLESPFVPSSTNCWTVQAKMAISVAIEVKPEVEIWRQTKKINFLALVSYSLLQLVLANTVLFCHKIFLPNEGGLPPMPLPPMQGRI